MEMQLVQTQTKILMKMDPQINTAVVVMVVMVAFFFFLADGVTTIAALVRRETATTFRSVQLTTP